MILIKTTTRNYSIKEENGVKHFTMGYNTLGLVLCMNEPKVGQRLTVKFTATGGEEDFEIHVTSPILEIITS